MTRFFVFAFSLVFLFVYCKNDYSENSKSIQKGTAKGHARMVAILDSIAKNASPIDVYSLNSKMAAMLGAQLGAATDPAQKISLTFKYGIQLLNAGKTKEAITAFETVIGAYGQQINANNKIVYEMYALAWLRLGEQENCIQNHSSESCILPIAGAGLHKATEGSTKAIEFYEVVLKFFPDDLQSKWLLNVAYQTLGKYPAGVPKQYLIDPAIFRGGKGPRFENIAVKMGLDMRGLSGGTCMEDFNNDGFLDIFATSYGLTDQCRIFWNKGDGTFEDGTEKANLKGIVSGLNCLHADYDNDGFRDIFILRGGWLEGGTHPNSLLHNNGDGTFTDATIDAKMLSFHPTQTGVWADFDGDGWLDLFVANETKQSGKTPHPCELWMNQKNGTFKNEAQKAGVAEVAFFKACAAGDVNDDGLADLYLSALPGENRLFLNKTSEKGQVFFENVAAKAGVTKPEMSFPSWFWDFDNDGLTDIFSSGYDPRMFDFSAAEVVKDLSGKLPEGGDNGRLYRNRGDGTFEDVSEKMGVNRLTFAMGSNFGDLDNDGFLDYYLGTGSPDFRSLVPNRMFRNVGGKRFEEISMDGFASIQKGHGVAFGDLDNDGDQDIYTVMGGAFEGDLANNLLFENPGNTNHFLTVRLVGKTCTRDAFLAKIIVKYIEKGGKKSQSVAVVGTGGSFGASSLQQEIGLGQAEKIESVEINWPKPFGQKTVLKDVPMDAAIEVVEGQNVCSKLDLKKIKLTGGGAAANHEHHHH